ncbi:hypothetical protein LguiB_017929 [Lonicera macranthoides]
MTEVVATLEFALAAQTSKDSSLLAEDVFDFGPSKPESIVLADEVDIHDAGVSIPKDDQLANPSGPAMHLGLDKSKSKSFEAILCARADPDGKSRHYTKTRYLARFYSMPDHLWHSSKPCQMRQYQFI